MTPTARLERIAEELVALKREGSSALYFVPVGLVSMALFFARSALSEITSREKRFASPPGGGERGLPVGDR
ncbi:MAG: hypothetical protein JEY79_11010 [Pseudodesulfovibrio sp.]|nr:hypothetical protein [Pseudodesulfovibrio sp.]